MYVASSEGRVSYVTGGEDHRSTSLTRTTNYIGKASNGEKFPGVPVRENGPNAYLREQSPENYLKPHYHLSNQFQVVVGGSGHIGKREWKPLHLHYVDGQTPYGPIVAGEEGLKFFTLRARRSGGFHPMPGSLMKIPAGRTAIGHVNDEEVFGEAKAPVVRRELFRDSDGLMAAFTRLAPGTVAPGEEVHGSGGHYYLITKGSLIYDGKVLPPWSLVFEEKDDSPADLVAGDDGVQLLTLRFPVNERLELPAKGARVATEVE
jgi:hypothetical protein